MFVDQIAMHLRWENILTSNGNKPFDLFHMSPFFSKRIVVKVITAELQTEIHEDFYPNSIV